MKKTIILTLFFVAIALNSNSQTESKSNFKADKLSFDKDSNVLVYSENASFTDEGFEIKKADKICFDPKTRKIIAYSVKEFKIIGSVEITEPSKKSSRLEYTIGETVAYIK